jgi:hypothetical protein
MFLTSLCTNSTAGPQWYLHEVDLTNRFQDVSNSGSPVLIQGSSSASNDSDDYDSTTQTVSFKAIEQSQRPALLEVQNTSAMPNRVI